MRKCLAKRPRLEGLESRRLLTTPPFVQYLDGPTGRVAILQGTAGNDNIVVSGNPHNRTLVTVNGGPFVGLHSATRYLYIDGNAGNDNITVYSDLACVIHGGKGNDTLFVNSDDGGTISVVRGDEGLDTFQGDPTRDAWIADPDPSEPMDFDVLGESIFLYLRDTNGDPNNDVVVGEDFVDIDGVYLVIFDPTITTGIVIDGNEGNDDFVNMSNKKVIAYGGAGNDTYRGRSTDSFYGEAGADTRLS